MAGSLYFFELFYVERRDHGAFGHSVFAYQMAEGICCLLGVVPRGYFGSIGCFDFNVKKHIRGLQTELEKLFQRWHALALTYVKLHELFSRPVENVVIRVAIVRELTIVAPVHYHHDIVFA